MYPVGEHVKPKDLDLTCDREGVELYVRSGSIILLYEVKPKLFHIQYDICFKSPL